MKANDLRNNGWEELVANGHTGAVGPFWTKSENGARQIALIVEPRHCNTVLGVAHGGVLMTMADVGLGFVVFEAAQPQKCVTADLQIQFLSTAKIGEVLVCEAEVLRKTKSLVFMRGTLSASDRLVASLTGLWKVL